RRPQVSQVLAPVAGGPAPHHPAQDSPNSRLGGRAHLPTRLPGSRRGRKRGSLTSDSAIIFTCLGRGKCTVSSLSGRVCGPVRRRRVGRRRRRTRAAVARAWGGAIPAALRRRLFASLSRSSDQPRLAWSRRNDEQGRRGQVSGAAEAWSNRRCKYCVPSPAPRDDKERQKWVRPSLGISNVNCDLETLKAQFEMRC
ncbi:Hypothetical predicted protein, partial [Marmota monax]